jgi:pyruvate dehydrogenase E1 component
MFGFQPVGDLIWAAADQRARGFLLGATAGRTTLGGEGLQHQDGHSTLIASTIPNCRTFDPAFAAELAIILDYGMRRMLDDHADEFYYITLSNENYAQPSLVEGVAGDVIKGLYRFRGTAGAPAVRLIGSGAILREVIAAADLLREDWGVAAEIWSATSYSELAREAAEVERWNRLNPGAPARNCHLWTSLAGPTPIVAASDYVRAWPQLIAAYLPAPFTVLGTDGFGRSDTREALRRFLEVDRFHIATAALQAQRTGGQVNSSTVEEALRRYGIRGDSPPPWTC